MGTCNANLKTNATVARCPQANEASQHVMTCHRGSAWVPTPTVGSDQPDATLGAYVSTQTKVSHLTG